MAVVIPPQAPANMSPRKQLAGATSSGNFGVGAIGKPLQHPDRAMNSGKSMPDAKRATAPAMSMGAGKMSAERNSDHGPHSVPGKKR